MGSAKSKRASRSPGRPPKKKAKRYGDQPLCLRFREGTKVKIERKATARGMSASEWIRSLAREQARLADLAPPLVYTGPGSRDTNEQVCVRFAAKEYAAIEAAAKVDGVLPSPWLRAVVEAVL